MQSPIRKITTRILAVCVLPLAFAIATAAQGSVKERLVGAWELVSFENIAADGTRRPGAYDRGQINYDASGRMSAHLMNNTDKANHRYLGYYGPFVVEESKGIVTHIVEGSSNANWVGSRQVRYYELSPDNQQLTLSVKNADGRVTGTLVWKRSR
jgi:hypothetical protein